MRGRALDLAVPHTPPAQVALQEEEYRRWTEALEGLLDHYYSVGPGGGWQARCCLLLGNI
jgi:hypothetical protein